jgi:hypothetical protein
MTINHSFNILFAEEYQSMGIAVLIAHFQYWILKNKALKRNLIEERTWTYQTVNEIAANFPYLSVKQVERLLDKMEELKIIRKGNFNKNPYNRTSWYCFEDEIKFSISRIREMEIPESGNEIPEFGKCYNTDTIPDTIPETNCPVVDSPVGIDAKENIPSKIIKYNMRGEEVSCSLDEIFRFAIQQRKDWKTSEINEAWSVLIEYTGAISKYIEFIAGTIKQKRIEVVSKFNRKKEKKCQDIQIVVKEEVVSVNKGRSLADCMRERALENSCAMNSP